ncbi:MAG: serine/threonine-protein phosphatase [Candidatus Eisenbacteria bacterium]|uniref:Serine/threonine-protein phosphatase n=1 Tax=Eiseniibacteriota bacterium TaxID=2212470 RepID=A0A849SGV0_UNCEI|nr:serine/threonine-protein phosphatase [Candidatus Eisenbacteria bacterium]
MSPKSSGPEPLSSTLLRQLWLVPVSAIPFALFFGTVYGSSWSGYVRSYQASLVFSAVIAVAVMASERALVPQLQRRFGGARGLPLWAGIAVRLGTSIGAAMIGAMIVNSTVMPGLMGSMRGLLVIAMYSILFSVLVIGAVYAWVFYHQSLDKARSEQELEMARRIQRSFLISQFPDSPRFEIHAYNRSSREVSGDFYDVVPSGATGLLLAVADVAGKGVPAALLTSMLQASVRTQAAGAAPVSEILEIVNGVAHRSTSVHQFATFFLARLDEQKLTLEYCNAGHNPPLLWRSNGECRTLDCGGTVVGILPEVRYAQETLALGPGDRLLIYSDGLTEAEAPDGEQYGEERLTAFLGALPSALSARELLERVLKDLDRHLADREAGDDVTLLTLRVLDPDPRG